MGQARRTIYPLRCTYRWILLENFEEIIEEVPIESAILGVFGLEQSSVESGDFLCEGWKVDCFTYNYGD